MGRAMAETNKRQAFVIEGAEMLPNDRGTRPANGSRTPARCPFCCPARRTN